MSNIRNIAQSDMLYLSKDVANMLNIANTTVRKYCEMLENQGYSIKRNDHGHRLFSVRDIEILETILKLKSEMKIDEACKYVIEKSKLVDDNSDDMSDITLGDNALAIQRFELINHFKEMETKLLSKIEEQNQVNEIQKKQLKEMETKLLSKFEERGKWQENRDNQLIMMLREISAAKEKKKKWWKFW